MSETLLTRHRKQLSLLSTELSGNNRPIRVKKATVSNLFRYEGRIKDNRRQVDLSRFNKPLHIDPKTKTLDVQGLTTFEQIVTYSLEYGFVPLVTPELKRITIGGAIVGIGIETNSYRYGFVHDSLLEADVLLPDGRIVTCSPSNEYKDLFYGLPNSYGTLGYILRARIKLRPAKKYVKLTTHKVSNTKALVATMKKATSDPRIDYMESLIYSKQMLFFTACKETNSPKTITSIYGKTVFYRLISTEGTVWLKTKDYLFRYDPEWFWAIPETGFYAIFRSLAPRKLRSSSFYTRYLRLQEKLGVAPNDSNLEKLIQDWEVPWKHAQSLLDFALENLDLDGKPLMTAPTKNYSPTSLYPIPIDTLYLNLGSYNFVGRKPNDKPYHYTQLMDTFCFEHEGIKMLYSSTFLDKKNFDARYGGTSYELLKKKYDPQKLAPTLYQKAVQSK